MIELAEKINLHLQLGEVDVGFYLSEEDLRMIVKALRHLAATEPAGG